MKFQLKKSSTTNTSTIKTDCLAITTSCLSKLKLSKVTLEYINAVLQRENLQSEKNLNKAILLFNVPEMATTRLLIVNLAKKSSLSSSQFITMMQNIANKVSQYNIKNLTVCFNHCKVKERNFGWQVYQAITGLSQYFYCFDHYKSPKNHKDYKLTNVTLLIDGKYNNMATLAYKQALAVNAGQQLTKDLANTPPNVCTTEFMAATARAIKKQSPKVKLTILEKKDLKRLNMGAFLAVAQGSLHPPKLICLEYNGYKGKGKSKGKGKNKTIHTDPKTAPIVLVGKGITFDTGGNSIKPANYMVGMKYDMSGAATVLGLIQFAIEMKLNLNVVGVIPVAENMPGRHACRPDDVVTTMSGQTVEILNTDAEGRLILCDALTYCKKYNPKVVIDMATLTGACVAALGQYYSGIFTNNQELTNQIINAGNHVVDKIWQLPMTEEYYKQLDSNVADLANIGGPYAGSTTAACFLAKFTEDYKWAHLDIAGTAYYSSGKNHNYATGRPVAALAQYLVNQVKK
jgi:leucyl aminopeptidase